MRITTISYERLHTFGPYENEKFRAEAMIEEGDDESHAAQMLRLFVDNQIDISDARRRVRQEELAAACLGETDMNYNPFENE